MGRCSHTLERVSATLCRFRLTKESESDHGPAGDVTGSLRAAQSPPICPRAVWRPAGRPLWGGWRWPTDV